MSSACPLQRSAFTSIRSIPLTTPPHCKANPAHEPTSPPPPMMLTIISDGSRPDVELACLSLRRTIHSVHDLIGDRLHQILDIPRWFAICRGGRGSGNGLLELWRDE